MLRALKVRRVVIGDIPTVPAPSVRELEERVWVTGVRGVAGLQGLSGRGLPVGVRGGRVGTFARAAARLCTGARLLHFPSLRQRGLVDILKAKSLSLVFVKGVEGCFHTGLHSSSRRP